MSDVDNSVTIPVTRNGMGQAEPELAHKLVATYLDLLDLEDRLPGHIRRRSGKRGR